MSARMEWADYASAEAHKLLTDNRALYMAQSAATRDGDVADFQAIAYAAEQMADHPESFPSYADRRGF